MRLKMEHPKVVVSIPTYNQAKYIVRAINSALRLDYENLHVNVCDDCSTDETWQLCQQFKGHRRISLYRNETNVGRVENYQKLFYQLGKGAEWIINLDGDDFFIRTDFVKKAMENINSIKDSFDVVLYHYQFDINPFKTFDSLGIGNRIVKGSDYIVNRPLVTSFFHFGAIVNRTKALSTNFYMYPSLNTDALSLQGLALQGYVIVDAAKIGNWSLNENSETKKAISQKEIELYEVANKSFMQVLRQNLTQTQLQQYFHNLEVVQTKEKVISLFRNRHLMKGIRQLVEFPEAFYCFPREVLKSIIGR
jgi:glycosyltransferase involved in cell wall biosynthesis